ncbi:predicted protein [Sclerotinia sclerotiorum 1980 UF-70]|uniref:Uncharacterized protein n=1 Tax=Sclerotinia sclerotiorum (strain ATCC 18683 / 1980 / Ss-1) TaxID=665079 RepID=A7EEU0_SCLS1|nr:predicted protein [Sclerotinia sclerotiorum 1980 UF-70]EDO01356.1 predicted protein [Sclerotinia sclerotiorum 1980 UF-70]
MTNEVPRQLRAMMFVFWCRLSLMPLMIEELFGKSTEFQFMRSSSPLATKLVVMKVCIFPLNDKTQTKHKYEEVPWQVMPAPSVEENAQVKWPPKSHKYQFFPNSLTFMMLCHYHYHYNPLLLHHSHHKNYLRSPAERGILWILGAGRQDKGLEYC